MDYDKWEDVLIQWINCLKLTEPINDLESLRNGDFFVKLLRILEPKHTSTTNEECFTISLDLIKAHYQNYNFDGGDIIDLTSLSTKTIVTICSLLLHYACVVERADSLIVPSCNKLPAYVQTNIKNFLEKVNSRITNFHFQKIIDEMNQSNISSTSYQWLPIGDSPLIGNSPLQDFLRSPTMKTSKLHKDREIKRLKSELEIERFEKADLQEELKEHKEQIVKLGNQIKEKSNQISKLRSELYASENKTPPHNQRCASSDIERQLKLEIQNLEQYVDQLQGKHDELQEENMNISEKLRISTKELKVWETAAQSLELSNKELSEKYLRQQEELENLKDQCSELSAILDEIRNNDAGNDSSMYFSPARSKRRSVHDNNVLFEDLAHTIIDVQLKDAQTENAELKNLLIESTDKGNSLQTELADVKKCYEELSKDFVALESERSTLLQKVTDLNDAYKAVEHLKHQTQEEVNRLVESHAEKDDLIATIQRDFQASSDLCNNYATLNENLNNDLARVQSELEEYKSRAAEKDALYEGLQKEADLLQVKYDDSVKNYNATNFVLENLKKKFAENAAKMEKSLLKLEHTVYGYNEMKLDDDFMDNVIMRLESNKSATDLETKNLKRSLNDYEDLVLVLRREINELRDEEKLSSEEKEHLKKLLEAAEANANNLRTSLEERNQEIKDRTDQIAELNDVIGELKKLEEVVAAKDLAISEMEAVSRQKQCVIDGLVSKEMKLNEDLQKMEEMETTIRQELTKKDEQIGDLCNKNSSLNQQLLDMNSKLDDLTSTHAQQVMEQEKMYLEKIHLYNLQIEDYSKKFEQVQNDMELTAKNLELKCIEFDDLQDSKRLMEEKNVKITQELQRKIEITEDTIKKLQIEFTIVKSERDNLKEEVGNLNADHAKIISEKERLSEDVRELKSQLKLGFEKLSDMEEECSQKDNIITENSKELLNLKLELESKKQAYKSLQEHIEKLNMEGLSYKFCIETLELKNSDFQGKTEKLEKELEVLNGLKESLEMKNKELSRQVNDVLSKLATKEEETTKLVKELSDQKRNYETELKTLHDMLKQANKNKENIENERDAIIDKSNKQISLLKEEINNLNDRIYELNAKEVDYVHELQVIKSELNTAFEKYTHSFDEQQELKSEYEAQIKNLTENLHEVVAKYNQLEKNQRSDTTELEAITNRLEMLEQEKVALEIKIIDQKKKYDQEIEETNEHFSSDLKQLQLKQAHLEQSLFKAESDLELQRGTQYRLENDVKRLTLKLSDIEAEKAGLSKNIESLENIKFKLEEDYCSLKLCHENYILQSESKLKLREEQFQNELNSVQLEKGRVENEIKGLLQQISTLQSQKDACQRELEENEQKYQERLSELNNKFEYYRCTNARITEEQVHLRERISNYENQTEEQAETISKLKSAYDILQTGKERIEVDLKNLREVHAKIQNEHSAREIETNALLAANEEKIKQLNRDMEIQMILLRTREEEIENLTGKLSDLQRVNATMKTEIESLEDQLRKSDKDYQVVLNKIDEENLLALNEMSNDFGLLKTKYEEVSEEINSLHAERDLLKNNIENLTETKAELQGIIENKETFIKELQLELDQAKEVQNKKETVAKELTEELAATINKLAVVKSEKLKLDVDLNEARLQIDRLKKSRDDILETQHKIIKETEDNILRVHANAIDVKNDLLNNIENVREEISIERDEKLKLQKLLEEEKAAVKYLEVELLNVKNEKSKYEQVYFLLRKSITRLQEVLHLSESGESDEIDEQKVGKLLTELEENIVGTYKRSRELTDTVTKLQIYAEENEIKLKELENERTLLNEEKKELLSNYNALVEKNQCILQQQTKEREEMQNDITTWANKYEEKSTISEHIDALKTENEVLHQTVISLKDKNVQAYNTYNDFTSTSRNVKAAIDKILKDRNSLEGLTLELRQALINVQTKYSQLNRETLPRHQDQKESFEFIVDDIQKQFNRYSKIAYNLAYNNVQISEKVIQGILSEKYIEWQPLLNDLNIDEVAEKLEELSDRTSDALEQLKSFGEVLEKSDIKCSKILKENILKTGSSSQLADLKKEEEWRKKYTALRQKLTLTENVKNNYEKKVRQLREENKRLASSAQPRNLDEDASYKILLQQHIQAKEEFEKKVSELKTKYQKLQAEYGDLKRQKVKTEEPNKNDKENQAIKEAYGKLMADNTKLELENATLRNVIEDKHSQLVELSLVREAYEKLLEENSKMMTEVDTLKYKRSRDKEEFFQLLKRDREERESKENKNIQQIRVEYEKKLESMKAKMLNLYKEEIDRENRRWNAEKNNSDLLKIELQNSKKIIEQLKMQNFNPLGSRESLGALSIKSECDARDMRHVRTRNVMDSRNGGAFGGISTRGASHDRRYATLPRNMCVIEEGISKTPPITAVPPDLGQNLEMEDEGELFNNKYLADLKEGHCVVGGESRSNRVSELAWRNSLCPPHLKSSYPAELQFASPTRFKEEDIKAGNVDFDDSMSTKLLPGEKARKKDIGTTSYKKPGPPTPSKNGGRLSLQSNDIQFPRDSQDFDAKTPKRTTPGRLKAFFLGLNSNTKGGGTENQTGTPKQKAAARIFRKAR